MNKKNLALAMSAITVVSAAAPVFADSTTVKEYTIVKDKYKDVYDEVKDLVKANNAIISKDETGAYDSTQKIQEAMDAGTLNKITMIKKKVKSSGGDEVKIPLSYVIDNTVVDTDYVETTLKGLDTDEYVDFEITNTKKADTDTTKVYSETDLLRLKNDLATSVLGKVTKDSLAAIGVTKVYSGSSAAEPADDDAAKAAFKANFDVAQSTITGTGDTTKLTIKAVPVASATTANALLKEDGTTQVSTKDIVVSAKDEDLDFSKPTLDVDGKIAGFEKSGAKDTITGELGATVKVRVVTADEKTIKATDNDALKAITQKYEFNPTEVQQIYNDVESLNKSDDLDGSKYDVDGTYKAVFYATGKRLQGFSSYGKINKDEFAGGLADGDTPLKLVIESTDEDDFVDGIEDFKDYNKTFSDITSISGDDRIETAIELSRTYYFNTNADDKPLYTKERDNVVLVGSTAIVDGLVASPLAAEKKAPLLLTSSDKLDNNVKNEIKRVMNLSTSSTINSKKKVYLVGGEKSISKDVEQTLKDMGVKVERLSGEDRYSTSLAIADEVDLDRDKAFVVGGTGLADAMSVAPVASQLDEDGEARPIVVVDGKADTLSKDAKDFIDSAKNVDIIGGENSVSTKVKKDVEDAIGKSSTRVSGDDRQATNAEVIKEYFGTKGESRKATNNFFVAKDGSTKEDQLVDALAAAAVAGNYGSTDDSTANPAPIVLATDNLSSDQHVAISKVVDDSSTANNTIVRVGGGIADSVINKIKDLLDL
ncbi:S-layer protein SlpA [Clostridioides sp. ZZV14-6009]|uniref:S-layer protein SlpA n=1 Tax=Clostridioides sp. ZZV14-6009 TaxID=2811487 RepID=UPI001D10B66E|nr:S-layer protein SlpA [Clostridioides sp. ZZV14-6009]